MSDTTSTTNGLPFEDLHPGYSPTGYVCTNEEPAVHRMLLKKHRGVKYVGSIASGGEVVFFTFLQQQGRKVIAVDHSYNALAAFATKLLLLRKFGPSKARELLIAKAGEGGKPGEALSAVIKEVRGSLPKPLCDKPFTNVNNVGGVADTRREWFYATPKQVRAAYNNLDNVILVHGDIRDLSKYAPFDLVYVSNAFSHNTREGRCLKASDVRGLIKPDGLLLTTSLASVEKYVPGKYPTYKATYSSLPEWNVLERIYGFRTTWEHALVRRVEVAETAKAKAASAGIGGSK